MRKGICGHPRSHYVGQRTESNAIKLPPVARGVHEHRTIGSIRLQGRRYEPATRLVTHVVPVDSCSEKEYAFQSAW